MQSLNDGAKITKLFQEVMHLFRKSMSKVFEDVGMTAPQSMLFAILSKEKNLKITELSTRLSLSNSTISGIVDRLEKQGMVERKRSEKDKRVVYVSVTPAFTEMHEKFHIWIGENIEQRMNKGTPEELDKIFVGLDALKKILADREE